MSQIDHNWPFPCAGNAWVSAKSEEFRFRNRENADSIGGSGKQVDVHVCALPSECFFGSSSSGRVLVRVLDVI